MIQNTLHKIVLTALKMTHHTIIRIIHIIITTMRKIPITADITINIIKSSKIRILITKVTHIEMNRIMVTTNLTRQIISLRKRGILKLAIIKVI